MITDRPTSTLWEDLCWMHFKLVLGVIWPAVILSLPPQPTDDGTLDDGVVLFWAWLTIAGAVVSIIGIVIARWFRLGVGTGLELTGLSFMFTGPFVAFVVYVYLACNEGDVSRLSGAVLAYALCAAMLARISIVYPRYFWARKK